jgi:hypothetical protein
MATVSSGESSAEELAQAAIVNIEAPAEAKPARKPLFGWGRPLGERA